MSELVEEVGYAEDVATVSVRDRPYRDVRGRLLAGRVRSSRVSPRVPARPGDHRRREGWKGLIPVNPCGCFVSLTLSGIGRQRRGDRDWPLGSGRRRPWMTHGRVNTVVPGVQRKPTPAASHAWETWKPRQVRYSFGGAGKPTVRGAEPLAGTGCPPSKRRPLKGSRKADTRGRLLRWPCPYNWPDTGPGARLRKQADLGR